MRVRLSVCVALRVFGVYVFETACVREVPYIKQEWPCIYVFIHK